jgi:murein DD-endopeptidase MepM/ murein hydrolase activator NlpD
MTVEKSQRGVVIGGKMGRNSDARRRRGAAAGLLMLLAACAPRVDGPAPVVSGGGVERGAASVTVQRGQTLSGIAQTYHVPMRLIAEANHLSPPYRIEIGRVLIIPGAGQARSPAPALSLAAIGPANPEEVPPSAARPDSVPALNRRETVPPDRPPLSSSEKPTVTAAPLLPPAPAAPPADTAPAAATPAPAPAAPASLPAAAAEPPAANNPATATTRNGGAFLWPVRGRVLATYGSGGDGTHNDGINISAPKGAAVQAADSGVVAYTGNELRGYGNLILVKHGNGWISAYAHCDLILVKRGEKVTRGQVIARVGSTGNVSEPQLHFELRRGNHAVDPREFLAPLPTAATKDLRSG